MEKRLVSRPLGKKCLDELDSISKRHGGILRPADVIAYAKNPSTALNSHFTWDDNEAARRFRLEQARAVIQVAVTILPGTSKKFRIYVSMRDDRGKGGGGYRTLLTVLGDKEKRALLLAEALDDFDRWQAKYETLKELAGVFAARRRLS